MISHIAPNQFRKSQRGATILMVAASLVVILLLAGLAIDLVAFYLGRSEAQRAADAGALAGAQQFVLSGFTSGGVTQGTVTTLATNAATAAAEQNKVGGQALTTSNITVPTPDYSRAGNPLITVQISKALPTFFMSIFGVSAVTVGTSATAEAYNPGGATGSGPTFCATCLKPFLLPNCDPVHTTPTNSVCPGGGNYGYFINSDGTVANPGLYPTGIVGEPWTLHTNQVPSHWYEIAFDCSQSGSNFATNVQYCATNVFNCGSTLCALDGNKVGPNDQAVSCLITYNNGCKSNGNTSTDSITVNPGGNPPFTITAGTGNPFFPAGTTIAQSASIVTVPLFAGQSIGSGGASVTVVGYLQIFIQEIKHQGGDDYITAIIMNASSCGTAGGNACGTAGGGNTGGGGTVGGGGAGFIPVRLIQAP
jgi:hypothetical protein